MIKTSIEKMANDIGFDIANSDDKVQSDLINGFSRGLRSSMSKSNLSTQLCYVVDKLDSDSEHIIKLLNEFIELKNRK